MRLRIGLLTANGAQQRIVKEEKNRERLRAGEAGLDMYGLRAKLKELGVVYVDQED